MTTLRDELIEVLTEQTPTAVFSDGTIKIVAEPVADALLPRIHEHTAKAELRADARARVEEIKQRSRAEKAEAEVERLTDWKESATTVMSGLQDLGKELGLPLGESITGTLAAETAHRLRTRAEKAEAAAQAERCCDWHNRNCEPPSELCCENCTEVDHPLHRRRTDCIAPDLSMPFAADVQTERERVGCECEPDPDCPKHGKGRPGHEY